MDTLVNGAFSDSVSVYDRGLAYGDGVFETIAVHKGESLLLAAHMQRLQQGCRRLGIPVPAMEQCCTEIERLCSGRTGILKLVVTRGAGTRGYAAPGDIQPTRILLFSPWLAYPEHFYKQGIQTAICSIRVAEQEQLAGLKHLNRLENVLAAQEILGSNLQEGLMLDCKDRIIECTRSNIFFVKDGELHTPALDRCGIDGVMRNYILRCAPERGVKTNIRDIALAEAASMDEAFVTNSVIGVWPIARLGEKISYQPAMSVTIQSWVAACTLGFTSEYD